MEVDLGNYVREFAPLLKEGNKKLSEGKAVVYGGFKKEDSSKVILKVVNIHSDAYEESENETHMMKSLNHEHIFNVDDDFVVGDEFVMVTKRLTCDYFDLFFNDNFSGISKNYDEAHIARSLFNIVRAFSYMHECGFIHRDIKPENIYVRELGDRADDLVVADFGYTKQIVTSDDEEGQVCRKFCGSPHYHAPEVLLCSEDYNDDYEDSWYSFPADVYSFGVMLYVILCRDYPCGMAANDYNYGILTIQNRINYDGYFTELSENAQDLIMRCLEYDPNERITFQEILDHPWFEDNFDGFKQEIQELLPGLDD